MAFDPKAQFAGLPIQSLICEPLIAGAKGQFLLCDVYLDYIHKLAYKNGKEDGQTNLLRFQLERPVTNGAGAFGKQAFSVEAPLLSLVPVPAFLMEEVTVEFSMEVKEQVVDETKDKQDTGFEYGGFWGVSIHGSVSAEQNHRRQTDNSATYKITAKASRQDPAEGMNKLTDLFASIIEPINVGTPGGGGGS